MAALDEINRICRERRIPLFVAMYAVSDSLMGNALTGELREMGEREQYFFTSTVSWFAGVEPEDIRISVADSHPNATGHLILGRNMATWMAGQLQPGVSRTK
jgi:hypothetical protein